ncbi:MAG: hypothetical protein BGO95_03605 [Micrococcales bacterium 73-13]|nr:MAG: hypothetical protein BGO95_03605 [Micrococcales bacterium 73-13]
MNGIPPIRREVLVEAGPDVAFAVFTEEIGAWWPLARLGVHHDGTVAFAGGRIVELSAAGEEAVWGSVTAWAPPRTLAFTWHPGSAAESASRVTVTFEPQGERTLVTLVQEGWEALEAPDAAREEYGRGWPGVLAAYARRASADRAGDTWVVLVHTPRDGTTGSVYADPRFREHVAFIERTASLGLLVAAGPFGDADGEGQTVLRLRGPDRLEEARRLAEADGSVAGGLFDVRVRPWRVVRSGIEAAATGA